MTKLTLPIGKNEKRNIDVDVSKSQTGSAVRRLLHEIEILVGGKNWLSGIAVLTAKPVDPLEVSQYAR
ncbi:hypothetical protein E6H21_07090 [Candidatus Bathyarchaeota archaeon]|nr:MAG: hypothetical protein E6H21_07090 [Candidatus Bathyarchaeota archaeon]